MKKLIDKKVIELAKKVQTLAIDVNSNTETDVNCEFAGHTNYFGIRIYLKGISLINDSDLFEHTYLDFKPKDVIKTLNKWIDFLNKILREGVSNE